MEFNKSVSNPMLMGCMELLRAEDTPEHRNMFIVELQKANFLAPALIIPAPEEDGEGNLRLHPRSQVQFPMLVSTEGQKYFMGFTDEAEYRLWVEKNRPLPTFAVKFDDFVRMLMDKDPQGNPCAAMGFVVNPYGVNFVVHKDMIANIMADRMMQTFTKKDGRNVQKLRVRKTSNTAGESKGDLQE